VLKVAGGGEGDEAGTGHWGEAGEAAVIKLIERADEFRWLADGGVDAAGGGEGLLELVLFSDLAFESCSSKSEFSC